MVLVVDDVDDVVVLVGGVPPGSVIRAALMWSELPRLPGVKYDTYRFPGGLSSGCTIKA